MDISESKYTLYSQMGLDTCDQANMPLRQGIWDWKIKILDQIKMSLGTCVWIKTD